jgi:chemotaxis protein methyltransferase CheR
MEQRIFEKFRKLIYDKSGITLGPQKVSLVSSRVSKRMRALQLDDYQDYLKVVLEDNTGSELVQLLDAISTNVTSFYREPEHFKFMTQAFGQWRDKGQTRFRIWCAASSTGEEPYTIAITALEALGRGVDVKILATDISTRVLETCQRGVYKDSKVDPVPPVLRSRYFSKLQQNGETYYRVNPELQQLLTFGRLNLSTPPFPMKGPMDIVICRNVMIYFDDVVRRNLVQEAHRLLKPGGYFIVGHSESLTNSSGPFRTIRPSIYQKQ